MPGARGHLGGEQSRGEAVFVGGPDGAVAAQEGSAGAFFAAEAERAVEQTIDEPLEADGNLEQLAAQLRGHAVDHAAGDHGLADGRVGAPIGRLANR